MSADDLIFAMKAIEGCPVRGHLKMLDDTRLVFIGENPDVPDVACLGFRNEEGVDTKIKLSKEAYEALKQLMTERFKGKRQPFPYKLQWQLEVTEK